MQKPLKTYTTHYQSPLGGITLASDGTALVGLWFHGQKYYADTLSNEHEERDDLPVFDETKRWLDTYFSGKIPDFIPPLKMRTSEFRRRVWDVLLTIPYSHTMTYGDIARIIAKERGMPSMSAQAVGGAVGHNAISLIIPCHRVIGADGSLTGYAGGIEKKLWLLKMEGALRSVIACFTILLCTCAFGQAADTLQTDSLISHQMTDVVVAARRAGTGRLAGAENGLQINREELFRAACCNLGESFTTNPSVDVSYSDATTGAKQIRLLGLSGIYVQMLTENLPNFRGVAAPFALDYVPGPWMQSIMVSKGASSVRNGYESITGQINVEYLKPDDDEGVTLNLYGNTLTRIEANADGNLHLNSRLSSEVLAHYQDEFGHHDINDDGFLDQPNVRQLNLQNRWKWHGERYLFHAGIGMIKEWREGGQTHSTAPESHDLYQIGIETDRYEGYMKHAFILDPEHGTNIALMGNVSLHQVDADYGHKHFDQNQKNVYAQLLFETNFTEQHNLSAGFSLNYDYINEELRKKNKESSNAAWGGANSSLFILHSSLPKETTPGVYAQYTYTLGSKLVAMAGLRADHSSRYGVFVTPRLHVKYAPHEVISLRLSAGKGYRTVHALAENHYLMGSGRALVIDDLHQESAWNYGVSTAFYIPLFGKTLRLNAEYYHTHFLRQAVIDYESDPTQIHITNLHGRSYSNTFQVDASYPVLEGLELTAAWRWNDVKCTYNGQLMQKPLTSRYKGLITATYKTPLGLWQFDATLQLNGGGRMPTPVNGLWDERFPAYEQLSMVPPLFPIPRRRESHRVPPATPHH